jgi:hypothetical protein
MKMLSLRQYAKDLGKTKAGVLRMIKESRLPQGVIAQKVDGFWIIITADNKQ